MANSVVHNKLVRDLIPDIIREDGRIPIVRELDDDEYIQSLEKKLDEEVAEFHESKDVEELADILEVVYALSEAQGVEIAELLEIQERKHLKRGGFADRIFLVETVCEG